MSVHHSSSFEFVDLPGRRSADPLGTDDAASSLRIVDLERTEGRKAHRHPHSEEVVVVSEGSGEVWIDGERFAITKGDVVRIPPGVPHATIPAADSRMELICFFPHPNLVENLEEIDALTVD